LLINLRFLIQPKPAPPRRDIHLQNVIINEKVNDKIAEHRISDLPFPFVNADQVESLLQQPLGREWNPETAFRRLNQPKVRTRIGVRIEPLNKQDVFVKPPRSKRDSNFDLLSNEQDKSTNLEYDSLFDHKQNPKSKFKRKKT